MEKAMILEAYYRGLLSKEECTKILGIDPSYLMKSANSQLNQLYDLSSTK